MNRREFLGFAVVGGIAILNEACAPAQNRQPTALPRFVSPEVPKAEIDYKQRLVAEIQGLPESDIKTALEARVVPMFQATTPFVLNLDGEEIWVNRVSVRDEVAQSHETGVDATYNGRKAIADLKYHPTAYFQTKIPALGLLKASETPKIPQENKLPDGSLGVRFDGDTDGFLDKSIAPDIAVTVKWDGKRDTAAYIPALRTYGYIKEACSFLVDLLRTEATIQKMHELGLPTRIDARDQYGNLATISAIPEALVVINGTKGRTLALLDLAAYGLALKVLTGTNALQILTGFGGIDAALLRSVEQTDFGSENEMFLRSFAWALNTPEAHKLPHKGDINKIP